MNIVIVDDDPGMLRLLTASCRSAGHEILAFHSSSEALDHLKAHGADLLIADMVVPPFDGLSLIRQARAVHPGLEAIAITGHSEEYTSADVVAAGASDLLMKPFRLDELHARVTLAAERRHTVSQIHGQQAVLQQTSTELIRDLQQQLVELRSNTGRADPPDA